MMTAFRLGIALAGLMGAAGVALAAAAAHAADASRLAPASAMLLIHALGAVATILLCDRQLIAATLGLAAIAAFILGAALLAGDVTLRQFAGSALFPMAAPAGGMVMIAGWIGLAIAAVWPRGV